MLNQRQTLIATPAQLTSGIRGNNFQGGVNYGFAIQDKVPNIASNVAGNLNASNNVLSCKANNILIGKRVVVPDSNAYQVQLGLARNSPHGLAFNGNNSYPIKPLVSNFYSGSDPNQPKSFVDITK